MNRIASSIVLLLSLLVLIHSCRSDGDEFIGINDDGIPEGYLVGITESFQYDTPEALIDSAFSFWLGKEYGSIIAPNDSMAAGLASLSSDLISLLETEVKAEMEMYMYIDAGLDAEGKSLLRFERHSFTYRTTDIKGNPIVLSGSAIFPFAANGTRNYLENVTLFHSFFTNDNIAYPSLSPAPVMPRAMFNSLVVAPDVEGTGETYGTMDPIHFDYGIMAKQAADCELAALELIRNRGIGIRPDYQTYNMGSSRGGGVAFSFARYMSREATEPVRKAINLKSTYCCCPVVGLSRLLDYYGNRNYEFEFPYQITALIESLYFNHREAFGHYSLDDLFSDKYRNVMVCIDNELYTLNEVVRLMLCPHKELNDFFINNDIRYLRDMLASGFFDADGNLDKESELYGILTGVMDSIEPLNGWIPDSPIHMTFSDGDCILPPSVTSEIMDDIAEPEVTSSMLSLGDHYIASTLGVMKMMLLKNPADTLCEQGTGSVRLSFQPCEQGTGSVRLSFQPALRSL